MSKGSKQDISALTEPGTVAVIGASERGHYPRSIFQNLSLGGFRREAIFPVNPKYREVFGLPCYPNIKEVPAAVDLAVIAVPRSFVVAAARECGEKGVRAISVISSGFAESGEEGRRRQDELRAVSNSYNLLVLGPNTLGHVAPRTGALLWSASLPRGVERGGLAAIFQSSGMLNLFFAMASQRRIGFSFGVAPGNEAGLNLSDYLSWAIDDPETRVVALVIESVREPAKFRQALERAWQLRKTIVALRLGTSPKAKRAITSHTGSLATSGEAWDALFEQKGVVGVYNLDELMETAVLLLSSDLGRIQKSTLGLITVSGGDCSLLSDICERIGLSLPDLEAESRSVVAAELKKNSFLGNPLDVEDLLESNTEGFYRSLKAFAESPAFGLIGCRLGLPQKPGERMRESYRRVSEIILSSGKQPVFLSRASEQLDQEWFDLFSSLNVPFLLEYEKGLRATRKAVELAEKQKRLSETRAESQAEKGPDPMRLGEIFARQNGGPLPTRETLLLFREYGIPFVRTEIVSSAKEAAEIAASFGYPVILKVSSVDIPHRSDIGAVTGALRTAQEVEAAYERVLKKSREKKPGARIDGVIVQPMVKGVGEMILGVSRDVQLGPVILVGIGGIFVEVLKDVVLKVLPIDLRDCREMIDRLRGKALIMGTRGRPRGDLEALARAILALSRLASEAPGIEEIDLNPVIVRPEGEGVAAVDGLVVLLQ
ncbi:MAG: acetate--CoA ligase family protein [Deltaproteobacteria bacterium]|nr:acetate--CoA ligase family protein [Deltaproteobacteria bacterium]